LLASDPATQNFTSNVPVSATEATRNLAVRNSLKPGLRIAYCHNRYQQRSGEDVAFDYGLNLLQLSGHEVFVYSRSNSEIQEFGWADKIRFPFRTVYSSQTRREILRFVENLRPEVALVQNVFPLLSPSLYYGLAEARIPVVQLLFNYRMLCANGLFFTQGEICERCSNGNYSHAVLHRCFRDSYVLSTIYATSLGYHRMKKTWERCVTLFVTPDEFLKNKLVAAGFDERRIRVVSNPFDASRCTPTYYGGDYGLFVGRLIRPKGIFTLLDAALRNDSMRLVVAGDGEGAESVRRHPALSTGRVTFLGPVYGEEFERLIDRAAFVDNLPMIVCQAFAYGKPVLASRINGIPEFVKHEENGLLFNPGSVPHLAEALARISADAGLRESLSVGARRTADVVLSPRAWQIKMNDLLRQAIEMGTPEAPREH
jgi:glycosyltransferase involved in cell wall biosynthesis